MKSKIFVIICTLASFNQASCSLPIFETEFGQFFPHPLELGTMAVAELKEQAAQKAKELLERSIAQIALDKAYEIAHRVGNSALSHTIRNIFTVENYDIYGKRALQAASTIVTMYVLLKAVNGLNLGQMVEATIRNGASKDWAGPLPQELEELLNAKKHHQALEERGLQSHNGYLFHGVPGTGKTLLARVLSDKLQVPLIETNSGQFLGMFQGSGNKQLKAILREARFCEAQKPFRCIVFIDEIDGLQRNRAGLGNGEEDRFMNDFLAQITDPKNNDILFIGATNFIDKIDGALKRDGRLVPIKIELPTDETRKHLITLVLEKHKVKLDERILSMKDVLKKTEGFSSATLDEAVRTALRKHILEGKVITGSTSTEKYPCFSTQLQKVLAEKEREKNTPEALPVGVQGMYS